jgi:hypothetical protein
MYNCGKKSDMYMKLKRHAKNDPIFYFLLLLLYWGYIVTFTKVLSIYYS